MPAPGHFVAYAEGLRRKLLRIWALLSNASEELRQVDLPAGAAERLERQLGAFTAELERSVSPAPGRELHGLFPPREASAATPREVRIEYAGLLGWARQPGDGNTLPGPGGRREGRPPGPRVRPARAGLQPGGTRRTSRRHRCGRAGSGSGRCTMAERGLSLSPRRNPQALLPARRSRLVRRWGWTAGKGAAGDGRSRLVPSRSRSRLAVRHPAEPVTAGHLGRQRGGKHAG